MNKIFIYFYTVYPWVTILGKFIEYLPATFFRSGRGGKSNFKACI